MTALPNIEHCLVAEYVREEGGKKVSVFGLMGVLPNVSIHVRELGKSITVAFLFIATPAVGNTEVLVEVADPKGMRVYKTPFKIEMTGARHLFHPGASRFPVATEGKYSVIVSENGKPIYEQTFEIAHRPES